MAAPSREPRALAQAHAAAERIARGMAYAGVALLGAGVLVLMADIAGRKTVGISVLGTLDLTQLAVMGCVFLAMPLAFLRGAHVGVEFITDRLPPRALAVLECAVGFLGMAFVAALAWYGARQAHLAWTQGDQSATLGIPMILYWAPLVVGLTASAAAALLVALRAAARARGA